MPMLMFLSCFVGFTSGVIGANSYYGIYLNKNILPENKEVAINIVSSGKELGLCFSALLGSLFCKIFYT